MLQIEDLQLLAALARSESLSAAARRLNVTAPALSMRLKRLEQSLGANLAVRSAHRMSLSPEGEALAAEATEILTRLNDIAEATKTNPGRLSGALRVVAPFGYGRLRVAPAIARFAVEHPDLKITLTLAEVPWPSRDDTDLVIHIGAVKDSSWLPFGSQATNAGYAPVHAMSRNMVRRQARKICPLIPAFVFVRTMTM